MSDRRKNRRIDNQDLATQSINVNLYLGIGVAFFVLLIAALVIVDRLFQPVLFQVDTVRYHGYFERVSPEELDAAVLPVVSGNILTIDIDSVERAVESLPWVSHATITKHWPSTIEVSVNEHRPVARWAAGGCVSAQGVHIEGDVALLPESIPLLAGPDEQASEILNRYQAWGTVLAGVGLTIESLRLSSRGAWRARLKVNDPTVSRPSQAYALGNKYDQYGSVRFDLLIGRNDSNERVARFTRVYKRALFPRVAWLERVDLRHTNGFAVKWINSNKNPIEQDELLEQKDLGSTEIGHVDPPRAQIVESQRA